MRFLNVGNLFGEDNFDANMIFSDLKLPTSVVHPAFGEFAITWKTSNSKVITKDGKINLTDAAQPVTMTATMKAVSGAKKSFKLTVCKNTAVINALLTEETMRVNGSLDEYTWAKWNEFVSRSNLEPQGSLAISWNRTDMVGVMDSVKQVIGNVPVYYLECTPDESAVTALEQQLRK